MLSFPAVATRPFFAILPASATTQSPAAEMAAVWAVSGTDEYRLTRAGVGGEVLLTATVTAGSVDVELPPSVLALLPNSFKYLVTNSCRDWPFDPPYAGASDRAPESGLYGFPDV